MALQLRRLQLEGPEQKERDTKMKEGMRDELESVQNEWVGCSQLGG
jgi:hypothetical protein